jgi:peptide methionine sulfoxide reductase msrA/msrB
MINWSEVINYAEKGNPTPDRKVVKSDSEWKSLLSPEEYRVTRTAGTERPHSSDMCGLFEPGIYACRCCDTLLFDAKEKFESGTGWPSFTNPIKNNAVAYIQDKSFGMRRIEAVCNSCDAHLGHVFPDGPKPTGLRYCMNAISLKKVIEKSNQQESKSITLGGGCFWCTEAVFLQLSGIESVVSGYSGGNTTNPTYREICSGNSGHAEVVQIKYDPEIITLRDILKIHLTTHDPTTLNRQGADKGTQYRSIIFYNNEEEKALIQEIKEELKFSFEAPIVTEVAPFIKFYEAEQNHQNYYNRNTYAGYCQAVINPKLEKFRKLYSDYLK